MKNRRSAGNLGLSTSCIAGTFAGGLARRAGTSQSSALESCRACKPTLHGGCVHDTRLLKLKLTPRKHGEIRNAANVVLRCDTREPFRVDLHHDCTPGEVSGGLRHEGRHPAAWSTPGRPEVRKNRDLALANHFVELLFVDFDRFADCRQLRLAGTAFANIGKVLRGNAIGPTASRAISNQRHGSILGHKSSGRPAERITQPYFGLTSFISSILPAVDVASRGSSQTPREAFHYSAAPSGRSVLERSRAGVTNGQSAFRASGDVTFRYLMRTGIIASWSDS